MHKSKIAVLKARSLVSLSDVRMTKNLLRGLNENPQGRWVQLLVHKDEGRGPHSSIFGRQLHNIFSPFLSLRLLTVTVTRVANGGG